MAKRCQLMEQEIENLTRDKQELQEKFEEKSSQKRKLDEMHDQLRSEYESAKRSAIQPANNNFPRAQPDSFSGMPNIMDSSDPLRQGSVDPPETPRWGDLGWAPPHQGNVAPPMVNLSYLRDLLLITQHLRLILDPDSRHGRTASLRSYHEQSFRGTAKYDILTRQTPSAFR